MKQILQRVFLFLREHLPHILRICKVLWIGCRKVRKENGEIPESEEDSNKSKED